MHSADRVRSGCKHEEPKRIPNDVLLDNWYIMMRCLFWSEYMLKTDVGKGRNGRRNGPTVASEVVLL